MRRSARRTVVAALAAPLVLLAGCAEDSGTGGAEQRDDGPIRIGAVLDITGAGSTLGQPEQQALRMLADQVNEAGGVNGRQLELVIEDDQSAEDIAARAVTKLISQDQVDIVLGASRTGTSLAMTDIAESSEVPMISLAANLAVIDGREWVFKTAQNDRVVVENIIDYAVAEGWRTLGLIRDSSAFGEGVRDLINEVGSEQGISVATEEKFAPDATEFTAQMVNIRDADADANIIWGIPPAVGLAQKSYRQLGITAPVVQSHGVGNQVFLDTAEDSANGVIVPIGRLIVADQLSEDDPQRETIQTFIDDYTAEFGQPPSTFAGHAWDAFQLAVDAFERVGTDKARVRDHLENVEGFVGITGIFTMSPQDHSGLDKNALAIVTVENREWKLLDANRD